MLIVVECSTLFKHNIALHAETTQHGHVHTPAVYYRKQSSAAMQYLSSYAKHTGQTHHNRQSVLQGRNQSARTNSSNYALTIRVTLVVTSVEVLEYLARNGRLRICSTVAVCKTAGVDPKHWAAR